MTEPHEQPAIPRPALETIILETKSQDTLAMIDGAVWPPVNSIIELGNPNRDAIVRDVRLRLHPSTASIVVRVEDLGHTLPNEWDG